MISVYFSCLQVINSQQSDTLYLNANWQICEKPFASYYRFSKIIIDSSWYYTGRVMDYYMNDTLQMNGHYSSTGEKDGNFWFFYPNGKLKTHGVYSKNERKGPWEYYYKEGKFQIKINYSGSNGNFTVLDFVDSTGKVLTRDSTGHFELRVIMTSGLGYCRLEGAFKEGKRSGNWHCYSFIPAKNAESQLIKEVYENGELKKGILISPFSGVYETYKKPRDVFKVPELDKFRITETFSRDQASFRNSQELFDFLVNKKTPSFDAEGDSFTESVLGVLKALNTSAILRNFRDPVKIYNGEIIFNLSDSGNINEIELTGNLNEKEKEIMQFFVRRFKNIHEITGENAGLDEYHKIYFYTIVFADFIPPRDLYSFPEKQFVFSPVPYRALVDLLKNKKRKNKRN